MASLGLEVYEKIRKHLQENNLKFQAIDEIQAFKLTFDTKDLDVETLIRVDSNRNVVVIYSPIPGKFSPDKIADAAIAVAAANHGLIDGSFDLDLSDGTISFHVYQNFAGGGITDETIRYLISLTVVMTDQYNDRFFMMSMGGMTLEQFLELENKS